MTNTWLNGDGLFIKYGTTEGAVGKGGQISDMGPYRILEFTVRYADVASATATILDDNIFIPDNSFIAKVEVVTTTAWDSGGDAFVFNLGTVAYDRTTEVDYNGLIAALPQGSMDPAGEWEVIDVEHTYKGAQVGTVIAQPTYVTVDYDTAAPTAGASKVRIYFYATANE